MRTASKFQKTSVMMPRHLKWKQLIVVEKVECFPETSLVSVTNRSVHGDHDADQSQVHTNQNHYIINY